MKIDQLNEFVKTGAAFRRRRRLQPVGGVGDKIFPPTYPGKNTPEHVFEIRRVGGDNVVCVLIDSVQSQANRLEEALLEAAREGGLRLPRIVVDFASAGLNSVPDISSLDAPHRIFDAILRDSELDGVAFRHTDIGTRVRTAKLHDASAILEVSPTALLFGAWNSTGEGGGMGAKFARAIVSEIIGVGVPVEETQDKQTGELKLRTAGRRTGSRIDPLGIIKSVDVYKSDEGWDISQESAGKKAKKARPSEINHGNIAPSVDMLGVTCDYAEQICVITLAGLRRLRFGNDEQKNIAARSYLAALGLVALAEVDRQGYSLRSRCDLVCEGDAPLEAVLPDGSTIPVQIDIDAARALYEQAYDAAIKAGFALTAEPLKLKPQGKLVHIVRESQNKALADEGDDESKD